MIALGNPYEPTSEIASPATADRSADRHWLAALPCLLPVGSVCLVILVVLLEQDLGFRGAILNDFSTPMGALFTISAYLCMSALLWAPAGLFGSIVLAGTNTSGRYRLWHPLAYIACCATVLGLLIIDPNGVFTHYFD